MKSGPLKSGFTLIEMLLVVAIIALLVAMVVGLAKRIDDQGKQRLCRDTLDLIGNALEQFRDFGYEYKRQDFAGLAFPLNCNNFNDAALVDTLGRAVYPSPPPLITITGGTNDPSYSGSEALYFILRQVHDCRETIDKIDKSMLSDKDGSGNQLILRINGVPLYPFLRFIDPWGKTLRYDYYDVNPVTLLPILSTKKTFPIVTSAGPDKQFDTADDIINRQPK